MPNQINHHVSELRTWMRIAERLDKNNVMPYETYYAKQLTK